MESANPYEAPSAPLGDGRDRYLPGAQGVPTPDAPVSPEELRAVVGPRADRYLRVWTPVAVRPGSVGYPALGFNAAAFLFAAFWLPYRKMYRETVIFYGIVLAEVVTESAVVRIAPDMERGLDVLGRLFMLVLGIACGIYGYGLYLNHACRVVTDCRSEAAAEGLDGPSYAARLERRGGTRPLFAFAVFFAFILLSGVIAALLDPTTFE